MSLRYHQFCPISKAAEILGERWTILILRELLLGTTRYSDLQRGLSRISPTLLTKRLNELVARGLVERRTGGRSARAEYHLTAAGLELKPAVTELGKWGMRWARGKLSDRDLDVQVLMLDLCRRLDLTALPVGRAVLGFSFTGIERYAHWWIVVEPGRPGELCVDHPGKPVDLLLRTDVRTLTEFWMGDVTLAAALRAGRLTLSGERALARTLPAWLRPGLLAGIRPAPAVKRSPSAGSPVP